MEKKGLSFRGLLSPVIARSLIIGVSPFDLEAVLTQVETGKILNARSLEKIWRGAWEEKVARYETIANEALLNESTLTAREMYLLASKCMFSAYLINYNDINDKREVYGRCASYYAKAMDCHNPKVELITIPFGENSCIPAYLHLPAGNGTFPCAVVYAGLGSCKEEMDFLARALCERGIAALVPDMPGCGAALFDYGLTCRHETISAVFGAAINVLERNEYINSQQIGAVGLCMGGGYAYAAAAQDSRYSFCATLFPLFLSDTTREAAPQWMKDGAWYNFQMGNMQPDDFINNIRRLSELSPQCPFFIAYGTHDNWVATGKMVEMFERASSTIKKKIIIEDRPVYSMEHSVTHTMPVGEQMHWVRRVMADWIHERCI